MNALWSPPIWSRGRCEWNSELRLKMKLLLDSKSCLRFRTTHKWKDFSPSPPTESSFGVTDNFQGRGCGNMGRFLDTKSSWVNDSLVVLKKRVIIVFWAEDSPSLVLEERVERKLQTSNQKSDWSWSQDTSSVVVIAAEIGSQIRDKAEADYSRVYN
jgi:hypothetical protein